MNKFVLLIFGVFIALVSCDGRDRIHKSAREVLIENKLLDSFTQSIKYFPEAYTETSTDTILSNGFRVKIKTFTDMENSVLNTFEADSIKHKHYFRKIISEVVVFKNEKQIFKRKINDNFLSITDKEYINNDIYIDELKSIETGKLHLVASQCKPRTVNCPIYDLIIDKNGLFKLKKRAHART